MKLTNTACKNAKPKEKPYKLFDGGGLFILINPNGSKLWRMKYRYLGKEKLLSFGSYPLITLANAREEREKAKKLLSGHSPIDPMANKENNRRNAILNAENSFKAVALEWHENQKERWSEGYSQKVMRCFEINIFPFIGNRPIADITPPELLDCLRRMEKRGALDSASRTKQLCGQVFRYGIQTGKCERDSSADLTGALKTRKKQHFRTLDIKELPDFLTALERNEARLYERTRRAIWFSLYTFVRPKEIRMARWQDIDFNEGLWRIPAEIMKMRKEHIVPLSRQALSVLKAQKKEADLLNSEWVFPSQVRPRNPMSDGTVNKAIKNLGFGEKMVAHGFRALARTGIDEKLKYDGAIIKKQLAHRSNNPLGEAYDRTQYIDDRIKMMQDWADYITEISNG